MATMVTMRGLAAPKPYRIRPESSISKEVENTQSTVPTQKTASPV